MPAYISVALTHVSLMVLVRTTVSTLLRGHNHCQYSLHKVHLTTKGPPGWVGMSGWWHEEKIITVMMWYTDVIKNKALPLDVVEMSRVIHQTLVRRYNNVTVVLKWPNLHITLQTKPTYEASPDVAKAIAIHNLAYLKGLLYLKMICNV